MAVSDLIAEMLADDPELCFPLQRASEQNYARTGQTRNLIPNGHGEKLNAAGPSPAIPLAMSSNGGGLFSADAASLDSPAVACEAIFRLATVGSTTRTVIARNNGPGSFNSRSWQMRVNASGIAGMRWFVGGSALVLDSSLTVRPGSWYHAIGWIQDGDQQFWVNGVNVAVHTRAGDVNAGGNSFTVGYSMNDTTTASGADLMNGDVAMAAYYTHVLTPERALKHFAAARSGAAAPFDSRRRRLA